MFHYAHPEGHRVIVCGVCGEMGPADFHADEFKFMQAHRHQEEAVKSTPVQAEQTPAPTDLPEPAKSRSDPHGNSVMPRLSGRRCLCVGCGRMFTGLTAFDRHRYFIHDDVRCCRDDEWLSEHGVVKRANGVYGAPPMTEAEKRERGWS